MYTEIRNPTDYKAALYIRLSKEDEQAGGAGGGESQSISNQRSMLREFTKKNRLFVFNEYIDDGWSGGNFDRPSFKRLIDDIEAKKVNMIITKDMSRLGRDYIQTGYYMEKYFPEKRVRYISLLDGIDTGTDSSMNDITPFRAIINDMYAKDISKKIKSVKHDKQRRGLFIGGKAPYGYVLSPNQKNTLQIDEKAAEVVKLIFQMALSGKSCREIAVELNDKSIPTPAVYANLPVSGKGLYSRMWSSERVAYMLKNQMYIGNMVQGTTKKVSYKSPKCIKLPKEKWVIVNDTHPAIIEKADFDKVQRLIDSRKRTRLRTYDYLLKGMIFCKECGYPLGVINRMLSGNKPVLYFVCRTYQRFTKAKLCTCHCVRVDIITEAIVEQIKNLCLQCIDKNEFDDIVKTVIKETAARDKLGFEMRLLSGQISNITANMDRLYSDNLNGIVDDADFQRLYMKLKNDRAVLQERLNAMQSRVAVNEESVYNVDELIHKFIETLNENRELLCSLVEKIELTSDKEVYVHFRFEN